MVISPHYQKWKVLHPAQYSIPGESTYGLKPSSDDETVTGQVRSPCSPAVATISLVSVLPPPPIRTRPYSVCQLVCPTLSSTNVWLVIHWPDMKDRQVVQEEPYPPPQMRRLSMVWLVLISGNKGSEQDKPLEVTKTSTLVHC